MSHAQIESRNYTFLGTTQSLCPECLSVVPAKIIARGQRVYFRKRCPTHGLREDFICSDRRWYDRYDFALPPKLPKKTFVEASRGCPLDCGLCTEHEQHTCVAVLEITDNCNLSCPLCYANSRPGLKHKSVEESCAAIDALVRAEGRADVLQISGGEPTTHPQLEQIIRYALDQPIDYIMLNTNGIRLAKDHALVEWLAQHKDRIEIYLQMDGVSDAVHQALRGEPLANIKLTALENVGRAGLHVTLVAALQAGVNEQELGDLLNLAKARPWISGLSLQPATYSGRHFLPEELEQRITTPDCISLLCEQSNGLFRDEDFFPLPCAHPNCHVLSLAFRHNGELVPLTRFVDAKLNLDLLANGLSFTREEGKRLVQQYLARNNCCGPSGCCDSTDGKAAVVQGLPVLTDPKTSDEAVAQRFFEQALQKQIGGEQLFRITITSFLDAYNFDVRRVMKCCTHHVLPSGHIIPFCAYNVLYRNGHVPLPRLQDPLS
ncbi:MAG: radical SAM protein [Planctomycetota bacterium]|nr:radical SAM protein [Planctomycetota bacterium]